MSCWALGAWGMRGDQHLLIAPNAWWPAPLACSFWPVARRGFTCPKRTSRGGFVPLVWVSVAGLGQAADGVSLKQWPGAHPGLGRYIPGSVS